ncbi:MAG: response regulator [candidate division NC10 bacterium]|nr:response regulator [candidate division NC10 bacterium]
MAGERILVVEDEPLIAQMLADKLSELYVEVIRASNGVEALGLAWERDPDLILLDIMMPKMDGFEVAKILKSNLKTSHIPIVFLTAKTQVEDRVRGLELGAEDYITKPFNFQELILRIKTILTRMEAAHAQKASQEMRGMAGKLRDLSLANLIQFLDMDQKTGILTITRGEERGYIYFDRGRIVNALAGPLRAEAAVYRLLTWAEGDFALELCGASGLAEPVIKMSNQTLILEGMRRLDEAERLRGQLPSPSAVLKVSPLLRERLKGKRLAPELERFLELFDGRRDLEAVLRESEMDELRALENVVRLYSQGMLVEA